MESLEIVGRGVISIPAALANSLPKAEGLKGEAIQNAFMEKQGFQCSYCTRGVILNCYASTNIHPDPRKVQ